MIRVIVIWVCLCCPAFGQLGGAYKILRTAYYDPHGVVKTRFPGLQPVIADVYEDMQSRMEEKRVEQRKEVMASLTPNKLESFFGKKRREQEKQLEFEFELELQDEVDELFTPEQRDAITLSALRHHFSLSSLVDDRETAYETTLKLRARRLAFRKDQLIEIAEALPPESRDRLKALVNGKLTTGRYKTSVRLINLFRYARYDEEFRKTLSSEEREAIDAQYDRTRDALVKGTLQVFRKKPKDEHDKALKELGTKQYTSATELLNEGLDPAARERLTSIYLRDKLLTSHHVAPILSWPQLIERIQLEDTTPLRAAAREADIEYDDDCLAEWRKIIREALPDDPQKRKLLLPLLGPN